jgi:hypothetical protein
MLNGFFLAIYVAREVPQLVFNFLFGLHASAVSLRLGDVIFPQLALPLNDFISV